MGLVLVIVLLPLAVLLLVLRALRSPPGPARAEPSPGRSGLIGDARLAAVRDISVADHDANCWYVAVAFEHGDPVRIAVGSEAEALELAAEISADVERIGHRTVPPRRR